jgi:hypothetical protein
LHLAWERRALHLSREVHGRALDIDFRRGDAILINYNEVRDLLQSNVVNN